MKRHQMTTTRWSQNSASAPKDAPMLTFLIIDDENFPAEEDEDEEEEEEGTMSLSDSPSSY